MNQAREANPADLSIYVAAAQLEEAQENTTLISKIVKKALKNLAKAKKQLSRADWLSQAV